jgi:hypothetical protein
MRKWVCGEYHCHAGGINIRRRQRFGVPNSVAAGSQALLSNRRPAQNGIPNVMVGKQDCVFGDSRRFHTASEKPVLRYR